MNPIELDELRQGLRDLADQPRPIRTDIAAARVRGRRVIRTRRTLAAGGTALALGAVAVLAIPGGGPGKSVRPASRVTELRAHHRFVAPASFGWLPSGWRVIDQTFGQEDLSSTDGYAVSAQSLPQRGDGPVRQAILTVFRPGKEPPMGYMRGGIPAKAIAAETVNGRPAHWLQPPPPGAGTAAGEARLRFELAPRQWAELEVDDDPPGDDVKSLLYRIARGIQPRGAVTAFPVEIDGLPTAFTPIFASVDTETSSSVGWSTRFALKPSLNITVSLHARNDHGTPIFAANTTIDGHPAYYGDGTARGVVRGAGKPLPQSQYLCVYGVRALNVCLEAQGPAQAALKPVGGLQGLFRQIKIFGPTRSQWSTRPLG